MDAHLKQAKGVTMRIRSITGVFAAAAVAVSAVIVPAAVASADTPVTPNSPSTLAAHAATVPTHHAGVWMSYVKDGQTLQYWMGSDNVLENGRNVIADCVIPGAPLLQPTAVRTGRYGSKRQSAELGYIMYNWGTSPIGSVAAGARLEMLAILGRSIPGLKVPAKIATYARNDLLNAERYAGPDDKASVTFTHEPTTPGQPGTALFAIVSATGHPIGGIPVRFYASAASIAADARSGVPERFTRTETRPVRVSGTAVIASGDVTIATAPHGQALVSALPARVTASSSYQAFPAPVRSTVTCNCNGTGNVTATVSQAAGAAEGQYTLYVNGKARTTVTVPAGKHGAHAVLKVTAPDGAVITFAARHRIGGRWTALVRLGGTFTVICPAMPSLTAKCQCRVTLSLANSLPKSSPYTEDLVYTVGGKTYTITIPAGASKTVTFGVSSGQMTYFAEVQRGGVAVTSTPKMLGGSAS
jgi:hypothetical protein